jgi:hypothetical protein
MSSSNTCGKSWEFENFNLESKVNFEQLERTEFVCEPKKINKKKLTKKIRKTEYSEFITGYWRI